MSEAQGYYDDANLVVYYDHGSTQGFAELISNSYLSAYDIYLNNPIILDVACSTCHYYPIWIPFCMENTRRGAIGFQGAVHVSYWNEEFDDILNGFMLEDKEIGVAYKEARNEDYQNRIYNYCSGLRGDVFYAWIGDPTLKFSEVKR
jgi:hypothetical protein